MNQATDDTGTHRRRVGGRANLVDVRIHWLTSRGASAYRVTVVRESDGGRVAAFTAGRSPALVLSRRCRLEPGSYVAFLRARYVSRGSERWTLSARRFEVLAAGK